MSGNPKQPAAGGQQLRYPNQYQSMAQLPPRESYQISNQNYVQQQPNQTGNQGTVGLRGISAQTGPPNQAQTPPNQDHKVQAPQQPSLNIYPHNNLQNAVRPQTFFRATGPPNQTRMANNQHRGQQQIYSTTQPQLLTAFHMPTMYHQQYFNAAQQRQGYGPPFVVPNQQLLSPATLFQAQGFQPQSTPVFQYYMPRQALPSQPTSVTANPNQTPITSLPVTQNLPPQPHTSTTRQRTRRPNAISVIDPATGLDKLDEMYENGSHPPSGESSARQTPQPAKEAFPNPAAATAATFAKQQQSRLSDDDQSSYEDDRHSSSTSTTGEHPKVIMSMNQVPFHVPQQLPQQQQQHQAVHSNANYEQLVQTSNLKAYAKEFVLNTAKETPVVSANCDAEEVTLPSKKGRESPAKGKKTVVKNANKIEVAETKEVTVPSSEVVEKQQQEVGKSAVSTTAPPSAAAATAPPKPPPSTVKIGGKPEVCKPFEGDDAQVYPEVQVPQNAKSKQSGSQRRDAQKTSQKSGSVGTTTVHVPPPQPAKPNSKTSKKHEINSKGVSKEGTEMDVFQIADTVNANNVANTTTATATPVAAAAAATNNTDIINANVVNATPNNLPQSSPAITNSVEANNKKNDVVTASTEASHVIKPTTTAAPQPPTQPAKTKVDVMEIFGGNVPKPMTFYAPPEPQGMQTDASGSATVDETDRMSVNDKIVSAKNEANAAKSGEKPKLPYKEGQWSPSNPEGQMKYDMEFLIACRSLPIAKVKPSNIPEVIDCSLDAGRPRLPDSRFSMGRTDFTNPPFMSSFGGKNSSMKGPSVTKHPSLTGKMGSKSGKSTNGAMSGGGNKISISLREDIKLHVTENAWKPMRLSKPDSRADEDRKTEDLYKKVRGVLNKLTPEKFDKLLGQIKELNIDTPARLQGVMDLIFEKAVDEPNFSVAYAKMCNELMNMNVPVEPNSEQIVNFRKLLLNRCQEEFEKQSKDETDTTAEKKKLISECIDPERKKELEIELEEFERRLKRRSVGNIRFIGELFKKKMLTHKIMAMCLSNLLTNRDEDSLECLCKLLSTIGNEMDRISKESKNAELEPFFIELNKIVDNKKNSKISSRIRFMIQDVIDLRKNNWVPRRQDMNPKTMDQIQKEAENELMKQAVINSVPSTPRKDERNDMKRPGKNSDDGDWTTQPPHSRSQRPQAITVVKDKLRSKAISKDEPLSLGTPKMFSSWTKGANIKQPIDVLPTITNKFALLASGTSDGDKKIPDTRYNSKGSSLERNYKQQQHYGGYEGRGSGSRSGSQQRMKDVAVLPPRVVPQTIVHQSTVVQAPPQPAATSVANVESAAAQQIASNYPEMDDDHRERFTKTLLDEFINDNANFEECETELRATFPPSYMSTMVTNAYLRMLDMKPLARRKGAVLFSGLLKVGTLPLEQYCLSLEEVFSQVEDLIIDIPTIWTCLAEILVPVICEDALPLSKLIKSAEILKSNCTIDKLLERLFEHIVKEKGVDFLRNLWNLSELKLVDCLPANQIENFVANTKMEFLLDGKSRDDGRQGFNYEQIEKKLTEFFNTNVPFDTIKNWITANVGERVDEEQFVRTLATAIYKYSIMRKKFVPDRLNMHTKLFSHYVDNNQAFELQCLFALQSVVKELEHPAGLLLNIVNKLNDDSILSQESFLAWEKNDDPAEKDGKGVAMMQLTSFFTHLKENEEDDDEGSTGDKDA